MKQMISPKEPILEEVNISENYSYSLDHFYLPYFSSKWHYHKEYEIIYIGKGRGTGFIGNGLTSFTPGTFAMVGAYTPHVWLCHNEYYQNNPGLMAEAFTIRFKDTFLGEKFLGLPGTTRIRALLEKSKHGILFSNKDVEPLKDKFKRLSSCDDFTRILFLLEVLDILSKTSDISIVSTISTETIPSEKEFSQMDKILKYISSNFQRKIKLEEVAEVAYLSPGYFSRFFKSKTLKSFTYFVNEIRTEYAGKLLLETNRSVSEICCDSGFNHLSHFYKQFTFFKNMTPQQYRNEYWNFRKL